MIKNYLKIAILLSIITFSVIYIFNNVSKQEDKAGNINPETSINSKNEVDQVSINNIEYIDLLKESRAALYSESQKFLKDNNIYQKQTPVKINFTYNNKNYSLEAIENQFEDDKEIYSNKVFFESPKNYIDLINLNFSNLKDFANLKQEVLPKKSDTGYAKWRNEFSDSNFSDNFIPTPGFEDYQYTVFYNTLVSQNNQEMLVTLADLNPADVKFINWEGGESIPKNTYTYRCVILKKECYETNILDKANIALGLSVTGYQDFPYFAWDSEDNLIFYLLRDRYTEDRIIRHTMHIYNINTDKVTEFELDLNTAITK